MNSFVIITCIILFSLFIIICLLPIFEMDLYSLTLNFITLQHNDLF